MMPAFSFMQLITYLCNLAGQALGVWLLAVSNQQFALVAFINALAFLLSSTTLYFVRHKLTHDPVKENENPLPLKQQFLKMYHSSKLIFLTKRRQPFFDFTLSDTNTQCTRRLYYGHLQSLFIGSSFIWTSFQSISSHF